MRYTNADVEEKRLSLFLTVELFLPAIKFCIVQSIPGLVAYNNIANIIMGLLFVVLFICNINLVIKRSSKYIVLTIFTLIIMFLSALIYGEPNVTNFNQAFIDMAVISSALFLTTVSIRNYNILFNTLLIMSPMVIFASIFMVVCTSIFGVVGTAVTNYNMSLSYYVLVPCFILFAGYLERRTIRHLILFFMGVFVIIAMGSRGPILCVGLFLVLCLLKTIKITTNTVIALLLGTVPAIVVFANFDKIIMNLYQWLQSINIESRTLIKLIQGSILDDSNRLNIINNSIEIIKDNIFGIGFMGNLTTHNILIENILWFGIILGMILNVVLIILIIRTLCLKVTFQNKREVLILVFFCYAVPDAFLNLTVWGKDMFWIYVALMLTLKKSTRTNEVKGQNNENYIAHRK